eukprot:6541213-Heterocapsa_arctica.AAC.1
MPAASSARTSRGLLRPSSSWLKEAGPYERCRRRGGFRRCSSSRSSRAARIHYYVAREDRAVA